MADTTASIVHLQTWIKQNRKDLLPPVSNKQLFREAKDAVIFVSAGPNTRNDFHVNPTEELFYQLKGTIAVRLRPLDGSKPYEQIIKEGELYLLPRWVPHRPQRPAGTLGLVIEFPRPEGQLDGLRWYCPACDHLVHEALWQLKKIDEDLKIIMEDFWGGPVERRTCKNCGHVIERAGAIKVAGGRVSAAKAAASPRKTAKKAAKKSVKKAVKAAKPVKKTGGGRKAKPAARTKASRR
ncbi:MAG: 3-hydroxyanthranilate 3,4-dioxygenase [Phycisphaerales bacterium]|jgi:3-hydroxyanthranilate 3,4-dioxygenase